jgi:predicted component of type VI protein secretion system
MRLLLTLVDGEEIDYKMEKDSVSIGRSSKCDLVIAHESMSRNHCQIEIKDGEFFITDLGSINGVYIDNQKIPANSSVPFQTFLHLAFGYVTSAQVVVDEATRFGVLKPRGEVQETISSNEVVAGTRTKTKAIQPQKNKNPPDKDKSNKSSGKNSILINIFAFLGILAALYYFLYAGQETPSLNEAPNPSPAATSRPTDTTDHF